MLVSGTYGRSVWEILVPGPGSASQSSNAAARMDVSPFRGVPLTALNGVSAAAGGGSATASAPAVRPASTLGEQRTAPLPAPTASAAVVVTASGTTKVRRQVRLDDSKGEGDLQVYPE